LPSQKYLELLSDSLAQIAPLREAKYLPRSFFLNAANK
jgi:hypothetical protein